MFVVLLYFQGIDRVISEAFDLLVEDELFVHFGLKGRGIFAFTVELVLADTLDLSLAEVMTFVFKGILAALGLGLVLFIFGG